ncbi:hypothetical protein ACOYR4_11315 [Acidovorax sp. M14]|uniref:hypothetical protein n=1 Tax=Acidovorax sp. M14 TaxID=3411354 RepID=UPI003BF5FC70
MRFSIWQSVQVSNPEHPRFGQAGSVQGINPETPNEVAVKFDLDSIMVVVPVADLKAL